MQIKPNQQPVEFKYTGTRGATEKPENGNSFGADQVTLNSSKVKSGGNPDDPMNIFYGWCTGGANDVKSMAGDITCLMGSDTNVKSGIEGGVLWCTSGASDVKSNLDDGPLFWCTGGAADAKSTFNEGQSIVNFCTGGATQEVKSNLDDGLLFWCTGGAADQKAGWLGGGAVGDYCFGAATDVKSTVAEGQSPINYCTGGAGDVRSKGRVNY